MNKRVLLLVLLLTGAIGGTFLATRALFSDTEQSADNTFTAGTLDMSVGGANGTAFQSIVVDNIGADGTVSGSQSWVVNNTGTLPGNLSFSVTDLLNFENGCNEPEAIIDTTCADPGSGEGELGQSITATVELTQDGSTAQVVNTNLATTSQAQFASQWDTNAGTVTIPAGGSVTVTLNWSNDPASYGNEIQSDSASFNAQFDLEQVNPS